MDSAAVFLFTLFQSDPQWTRRHAEEIRRTLGPYPASAVSRIRESINKVLASLPEDTDIFKDSLPEGSSSSASTEAFRLRNSEFGHSITFRSDEELVKKKPLSKVTGSTNGSEHSFEANPLWAGPSKDGYDSLSDDDDTKDTFSTALLGGMATKDSNSVKAEPNGSEGRESSVKVKDVSDSPYSAGWLREQCKECTVAGVSWQELFRAVFEHLSSGVDNMAIQNDVRAQTFFPCSVATPCLTPPL